MDSLIARSIYAALALLSFFAVGRPASAEDVFVGVAPPSGGLVSLDQIDHSAWDALLQKHVDEAGQVSYKAWKASAEDSAALDAYLAELSRGDASATTTREARLAYWINAYNAVTVKGILREYPTTSIRNHTAKLWGYNIWKNLKLRVAPQPINLDDIEHQVLRKMNEPRIHFAIVCASIGCPRLLNEAYVPERLDEQLELNAQHFFAQKQNFQLDRGGKTVRLSSILNWFGEDFGDGNQAVLRRISPWLADDEARAYVAQSGISVKYLDYDWGLNEQK